MTDRWNAALYIYTYIDYNYVVHWAKNKEYKNNTWKLKRTTKIILVICVYKKEKKSSYKSFLSFNYKGETKGKTMECTICVLAGILLAQSHHQKYITHYKGRR